MAEFINILLHSIMELGYIGIFILMAIQNSIFPFAMEIVLVPAGYLAFKGEMNLVLVLASGILGQVFGAILNYYFGDKILSFIKPDKIEKLKTTFNKHSGFFIFFMPGIRPYSAIFAGISKMNIIKMVSYVFVSSLFWVGLVTMIGYVVGEDENLVKQYENYITIFTIIIGIFWIYSMRRKK